jgi:hypothetical protein
MRTKKKKKKEQKASHLHFAEAFKASLFSERMRGRSFDQAYDDQVKNDSQYPNPKYSRKGKEQKCNTQNPLTNQYWSL